MLVVKETETPEIVDRTVEAVLDACDQQVGEAERHFLQVASVDRDDPAVEDAYQASIRAINQMWYMACLACYQAGEIDGMGGNMAGANGRRKAEAISA